MKIKVVKGITGYPDYKDGDEIENAEGVFGEAQTRYLLEVGEAKPVGVKTEKAVGNKGTETPEK